MVRCVTLEIPENIYYAHIRHRYQWYVRNAIQTIFEGFVHHCVITLEFIF